jgi:CRISPR system Cascade subunit CasE
MSEVLYLSRLVLDPRARRVQRELANPYELHRTMMAAFEDGCRREGERVLYRVDPIRGEVALLLLVQSRGEPDWDPLQTEEGARRYLAAGWADNPAVKRFSPRFNGGQVLAFRLRANPTMRRRGRRVGLYREEQQLAWLERKGRAGGFVPLRVRVTQEGLAGGTIRRDEAVHRLKLVSVCFEGYLQVSDPQRLARLTATGIGSAKGFGFGLLSLARAAPRGLEGG